MVSDPAQRKYDLEERTFRFALRVRQFLRRIPKSLSNHQDGRQLLRSSGSVGANYIEANESLGDKDFLFRVRISRKEARESHFWLRLLDLRGDNQLDLERAELVNEATELTRILGAIIRNRTS